MSNLPINWEDKTDSPELVAWLQQFGLGRYINAEQINKLRDAINELYYTLNPDRIITIGTETIVDNEHTYEGYVWQLGGIQINNTGNPSIIIIPAATVGFKRKDISVFTSEGNIIRVAGDETDGDIVATPPTPPGTLYFKSYDIDGDTIAVDPEPPAIDGTIYKKKIENTRWKSTQSGTNVVIPFQAAGQMHYSVVHSGLISVAGFSTAALMTLQYEGQDLLFENQTGNPITLKNMFGGVSTPFNFGADLVVPNGGKLWLKVRNNEIELILKSWADPIDLSAFDDVVEGYKSGSNFYEDSLHTILIIPETDKLYISITENKAYRWSGSAYVQLSAGIDFPIDGKTYGVKDGLAVDLGVNIAKDFPNSIIIQASGAGVSYVGTYASAFTGTQSDILIGGGGLSYRKVLSAATAGSNANMYDAGIYRVQPGAGFYYRERIKNEDATNITSGRFSYGFSGTAIMGNINPSTYTQTLLSLGADNTDANCQIMYKNNGGTATKIDLGATMPKTQLDEYVIEFLRQKGSTTIYYKITNLTTGVVVMNSFTFALNALALGNFRNNETVASACGFAFRRAELYITD